MTTNFNFNTILKKYDKILNYIRKCKNLKFNLNNTIIAANNLINLYGLHPYDENLNEKSYAFQSIVSQDIELCMFCVYRVRKRLELCEKTISKNIEYSFAYAQIIKNWNFGSTKIFRIEIIEQTILQHPIYSSRYAVEIIRGRWAEAEKIISTSAEASYKYAYNALRARFELGEEVISKDAKISCEYALNVLNYPFKLGEEKIFNSIYVRRYCNNFKIPITKEMETIFAKSGVESLNYARRIGKRFEIGEDSIKKNARYSLDYATNVIRGRFKKGEKAMLSNDKIFKKYIDYFIDNKKFKDVIYIVNKKAKMDKQ